MRKKNEIVTVAMAVLFASALFGCMKDSGSDSKRSETDPGQEVATGSDPAFSHDTIDERIGMLATYLEKKDIPDNNRDTAGSLLDAYRKIRTTLDAPVSKEYYKEINHILFDAMIMLEGKCLNLLIDEGVKKEEIREEMRESENDGPPPERIAGTILPIDLLDIKISMFEEYLERKDISAEDRETAQIFLSNYKKISTINKTAESEEAYREMTQMHLDTMIMVEERIISNTSYM